MIERGSEGKLADVSKSMVMNMDISQERYLL